MHADYTGKVRARHATRSASLAPLTRARLTRNLCFALRAWTSWQR